MNKSKIIIGLTLLMLIITVSSMIYAEETVNFLVSSGGSGNTFRAGAELFNNKYEGQYKVEVTEAPLDAVIEKAMFQFVSGNPTFDVVPVNSNFIEQMNHFLLPIDKFYEDAGIDPVELFGQGQVDVGSYQGKLIGVPIRGGSWITYYRKDLFEEAGLDVPNSLEEWLNAARKLTVVSEDGKVERYGTSLKLSDNWNAGQTFGFFLFAGGGRYLTEDNSSVHPSLTGEYAKEVLKFMKTLRDEKLIPDPLDFNYPENITGFQQGKIAFSDEYSARATVLHDSEVSQVADKMEYALPPFEQHDLEGPGMVESTWYLGIDKNSEKKKASFEFINFMGSYEAQKYMAFEHNNGPTALKIFEDPEFIKRNPAAHIMKKAQDYNPQPGLGLAETPRIYDDMKLELHNYLLGKQSAEETLENIANNIAEQLQ